MDLKTGDLFWPKSAPCSSYPPLTQNIRCDVAIIGGGLTGAVIAEALSRDGIDTVVLDKRTPGCGSTSASTALILYEIDTPLSQLIQMRGEKAAVRSYRLCLDAIDQIDRTLLRLGNRCDFARRPSLFAAQRKADVPLLQAEFAARTRHGFQLEYVSQTEVERLFSFSRPAALASADAAEIDPLRFALRLLERAQSSGARIYAHTTVRHIETNRTGATLRTATGHVISAKRAIVAAGFETAELIRPKLVDLRSTYVMVTEPVASFEGWHERSLIWETGRPYHYLRTTSDGRIMIGGGDEAFVSAKKRDALIPQKARSHAAQLKRMFPQLNPKPALRWAGTFAETKDGLPLIGSLPAENKILLTLCYGANGTNFAMIAAAIAQDWVRGKRNPDARLFALER